MWDPLVRIFHWTLVFAVTLAYLTGDELETIHVWMGYLVGGLLAFRVVWGFVGPRYARFSDFVRPRAEIVAYLKALPTGKAKRYLGHNPAGGAMILALLVSLALTVVTGLVTLEIGDHGIGKAVKEVHEFFANFTMLLVLVHILGVAASSLLHGENLVRAMITGRKRADP